MDCLMDMVLILETVNLSVLNLDLPLLREWRRTVGDLAESKQEADRGRSRRGVKMMNAAIWSNLSINERLSLIKAAYPKRTPELAAFEANKTWAGLLPSTKRDVNNVPWTLVVGRTSVR